LNLWVYWGTIRFKSAWMGKVVGGTTCSWNGYGGASSTKRSTWILTTASVMQRAGWGKYFTKYKPAQAALGVWRH